MNIDAVIQSLSSIREVYGDLPVYHIVDGAYAPLAQAPWLASPVGTIPGPGNYVVVFGPVPAPAPLPYP